MRSIQDLLQLQTQRMQRQREAVSEGLEQFVRTEEAKTKLAITAITEAAKPNLRTHA